MSLQDFNTLMPLGLKLQLTSSLFTQPSITLQRNSDERMNSNRWRILFPQPPLLPGINVELLNQDLWQSFYEQNTEMIITKCGRRMFPSVQIEVSGLEKRESYYLLLEITPASDRRHKYCGYESGNKNGEGNIGGWSYAGPAEPQQPFQRRTYVHPDSPATGDHWMDNPVNFNKLKITNNINDPKNNVVLTSMHKYVPKIWIIRCANVKNFNELFSYPAATFLFNVTEFIAVTAYQNNGITKLKIDNNPFAKGFRETGQSKFKRKYQQIDQQARWGPNRADDEDSPSDSESNHVASERDNVVSSLENLTQKSARRLAIGNDAENARDDIRPIAANSLIPIAENPRSPPSDHNEVIFHRPWLDPPSHSPELRTSLLRNRASRSLPLHSPPSRNLPSRSPLSRSSSSLSLSSHSPLSCNSSSRSSSSSSLPSYSPPMVPPLSILPASSSLYHIPPLPVYYFPYINPYDRLQNYRFHDYQHQFGNSYR